MQLSICHLTQRVSDMRLELQAAVIRSVLMLGHIQDVRGIHQADPFLEVEWFGIIRDGTVLRPA